MAIAVAIHNLCHDLGRDKVLADLDRAAEHASVGLVQERSSDAARAAFSDFRSRDNIAAYLPDGGPGRDPIWWKVDKWSKVDGAGWMRTHEGKEGVSPDRFFTWQPLIRPDGKVVLFICTHAINGYAKSGPDAPGHQDYRDASAKKHWNKGHDLIDGFIRSTDWPTIVLGGDFNCAWSDRDRDWYPGPKLDDICRKAAWEDSILTATLTKSSVGVQAGKDTLENVHSDHPIKILKVDL